MRTVIAIIVKVGFWQPLETQTAPSVTKTFWVSCTWPKRLVRKLADYPKLPLRQFRDE